MDHRPLMDAIAATGYEEWLTAERTPVADVIAVELARHERATLDRLIENATG